MGRREGYSKIACVGTGVSGIGLGATLKRWYGETDVAFFERSDRPCGTWHINQYPGCACDVPSVLYSYSYEPNANWTRVLPTNNEIEAYLLSVANKYDLIPKMRFNVEVKECRWIEESRTWRLDVHDNRDGTAFTHECKLLFSAAGQLVYPRELDVPGVTSFKGDIFHSARWDTRVDLTGKDVVVFGNGCTAAQIVPAIVGETKSLTQITRSKHWIFQKIDFEYPRWLKWVFAHVPFALLLHRLHIFLLAERDFKLFPLTARAARLRDARRKKAEAYMRRAAPPKYHDLLIPDFEIGCKRRIFDNGYLDCLWNEKLTLTDERALEIVPEGVRTARGVINADVIVMANGFRTNEFVSPMVVRGRAGHTLTEHWKDIGGAEAYNCSVVSGFPNFFMILGPNAATGHTSAFMASENTINYALRVARDVISGHATSLEIKRDAELEYVYKLQDDLQKTVWNSGCSSWYFVQNPKTKKPWNAMSYPYSQGHFWRRSLFPTWKDWDIERDGKPARLSPYSVLLALLCVGALLLGTGSGVEYLKGLTS